MSTITIHLPDDPNSDEYSDIANAIWMMLRATSREFYVELDDDADPSKVDSDWDSYSNVSWQNGGRRGTKQAERARRSRRTA